MVRNIAITASSVIGRLDGNPPVHKQVGVEFIYVFCCYNVLIVLARSTGSRRTYFENNAVKPAAGARPLASLTHPKF